MKRFLITGAFALSLLAFTPAASAASCTGPGDQASCGAGNVCQQDPTSGFYTCFAAGTATTGTCTSHDDTSCGAGNSCQQDANGFYACFPNQNTGAASNPGANGSASGFTPLASIPGLTDAQSNPTAATLAQFFNNLYKYLIGLAALLAVIQIIRGGLEIATQDNVGKHTDGRHHIEQAILGLVLVLSPALVFSLINPSILNLGINLPPLHTASGNATAGVVLPPTACSGDACSTSKNECTALGGTATQVCMKNGTIDTNSPPNVEEENALNPQCPSGETLAVQCTGTTGNGAGQAGLSGESIVAGANPRLDGQYMDLVEYTGTNAASAAQAYKCQSSSQSGPSIFNGPANGSHSSSTYALCVTLQFPYVAVSVGDTGLLADPATRSAESTYYGECESVQSLLSADGFTKTVDPLYNISPAKITCSEADNALGGHVTCYTTSASCGAPKN